MIACHVYQLLPGDGTQVVILHMLEHGRASDCIFASHGITYR